jgi:hypothetical protein
MNLRSPLLLLALLLPGCTLTSRVPLITAPMEVPGLADGAYQAYLVSDPQKLRKIPRKIRALCLAPGYRFRERDAHARPTGPTRTPLYCPYDEDKKTKIAPVRITRQGAAYRVDQVPSLVQFQRLREGLFLWQHQEGSGEEQVYQYLLARPIAGGLDLTLLVCGDFPSISDKPATVEIAPDANGHAIVANVASADDAKPKTYRLDDATGPAGKSGCVAPSLAAIQPELDVVAARAIAGDEPVVILLRRIASAGAVAGSPPR